MATYENIRSEDTLNRRNNEESPIFMTIFW